MHKSLKILTGVNHISTYQLTVEKGTQLAKDVSSGKVQLPSDNVMTEMYLDAVQYLEKNELYRFILIIVVSSTSNVCPSIHPSVEVA